MTLAGLSGALTVAAAWELIGVLQTAGARRSVGALIGPVRAARAGRLAAASESRRLALVTALTLLAAGYLLAGIVVALVFATAAPVCLAQMLRVSRERWRAELARGAPAVARAIADALSGGHSTLAAISEAARSGAIPGAASRELSAASRRLALGADQDEVLAAIARRAADPSWDALAAAVALQRRAGGDLVALLRRIAEVADERDHIEADARTLTAQARFTAWLVTAMPLAGLLLAGVVAPDRVSATLGDPLSLGALALAGLILTISLLVIGRIARPLR